MTIIPLGEAAEAAAGGKARSLGQLMASGFAVPPGFVVQGEVQDDHARELLQAYDDLGVDYVAVRSSALSEDGSEAAWAGQLDTYLNVTRDSLLARVKDCMQSASSERAKAYAAQKNISAGNVSVVVQAMVDSEVSGVAFSVHPVTKSSDHMVIEAGLGLGEAVVSGGITPDTYVVEAKSGNVLESFVSSQTKKLVRGARGETTWEAISPSAAEPKLSAEQIQQLTDNVQRVAALYGYPIDIEWAFANDQLYILQARPITTL